MAIAYQLKRSSTPGLVPSPSELLEGEMAHNDADNILYIKTSTGTIVSFSGATPTGYTQGVKVDALKNTAGSITTGTPVVRKGWDAVNTAILVEAADPAVAADMPAIGIAQSTITDAADGIVVTQGLAAFDTSAFSNGALLYAGTGGVLSTTRPALEIGHQMVEPNGGNTSFVVDAAAIRVLGSGWSENDTITVGVNIDAAGATDAVGTAPVAPTNEDVAEALRAAIAALGGVQTQRTGDLVEVYSDVTSVVLSNVRTSPVAQAQPLAYVMHADAAGILYVDGSRALLPIDGGGLG